MAIRPVHGLLLAACLALAGIAAGAEPEPAPAAAPFDESLQRRIIEVSDRVQPLVVHIQAIVRINDSRSEVTGSGLIARPDGIIVTNHHVVEKAEKVEVTVPGRKAPYPARILGTDKQTDIAVLAIQPDRPLPIASFGRAADVKVGQWVLAVGNPYGLDGTVSFGIVSAKGRNLEIPDLINEFIQTDAMIDRGSSGGPLVDLEGRVLGINSRGQGRGIGFTIPVDTVLDVMRQIEEGGVERGWLGITMQPLDRDLAGYFGVPEETGVIVSGISAGSPAERAGLRPADIVTHFDGHSLEAEQEEDLASFQRLVASVPPGGTAELRILRGGRPRTTKVTLGTQPTVEPDETETEFGLFVQEITERVFREQRLESRKGAYVSFVERGSPAAEAGLFQGDVVERIEGEAVEDLAGFRKAVEKVTDRATFLVTARRGSDLKFLLVKNGKKPASPAGRHADATAF